LVLAWRELQSRWVIVLAMIDEELLAFDCQANDERKYR